MIAIHYLMLVCAALAAGLPQLQDALPPQATPYLKASTAILVLLTAVLGAVSPQASTATKMAAKFAKISGAGVIVLLACLTTVTVTSSCRGGAIGPNDADASGIVETGTSLACSLLEGVDDSGVVRTICADQGEIATIISFVTSLRASNDGGASRPDAGPCTALPNTTFCTTSRERAKAILFVVSVRSARFVIDGGGR